VESAPGAGNENLVFSSVARLRIVIGVPVLEGLLFCPKSQFIALDSPGAFVKDNHAYGFVLAVLDDSSNHSSPKGLFLGLECSQLSISSGNAKTGLRSPGRGRRTGSPAHRSHRCAVRTPRFKYAAISFQDCRALLCCWDPEVFAGAALVPTVFILSAMNYTLRARCFFSTNSIPISG
jgi:hypothetical protein